MPVWAFMCEAPVQLVGASRRAGGRDSRCAGLLPGGGLSFKHVLASPDPYMNEICRWHPDLLVIDLGTNDPAGADCTVPDVVNLAMRFLALVDDWVHPGIIIILSVLQRTSRPWVIGVRCPCRFLIVRSNRLILGYRPVFAILPMCA